MSKKDVYDYQKYRFKVISVGDDSGNSFLLFETRYYAQKYLDERLLSREKEISVDGKFDLTYKISKVEGGFVILAIAQAVV